MTAALEEPVTRGGLIVRDERGRIVTGPGRPKGIKERQPREGTIRGVFEDYIANFRGHDYLLDAVDRGVQAYDPKTALGYLTLGARVLDRIEDEQGRPVTVNVYTNVNFNKLRGPEAQARILQR